ncbi:helix-turn-helix domain-containing protein [Salmonella sp. SKLX107313]|uniref:helix-turn-helix domain-containing protein n=1 Tax=Salmonella sp. SKLX107313 TaxID=3160038 RepID=UPI00375432B2
MLREMAVNSIIQYIEDNLENFFINIESLVDYSGYSRRYLQITFKEYMGIPVGQYIRKRRISRAAALLRLTHLPIIDISGRLFYDSQQTFTREFKKIMGYTPRQYRVNPFWSFKNLLGRREINKKYLSPTLCFLEQQEVFGKLFNHDGLILYSGVDTKTRWGKAYDYLQNNNATVVSNKIPFNNGNITAQTVVWCSQKESNCTIVIDEGLYAHFKFSGSAEEYITYMYDIYYNSLPIYNLDKKNSYDIEIIERQDNGIFNCHYYLPLYAESSGYNTFNRMD